MCRLCLACFPLHSFDSLTVVSRRNTRISDYSEKGLYSVTSDSDTARNPDLNNDVLRSCALPWDNGLGWGVTSAYTKTSRSVSLSLQLRSPLTPLSFRPALQAINDHPTTAKAEAQDESLAGDASCGKNPVSNRAKLAKTVVPQLSKPSDREKISLLFISLLETETKGSATGFIQYIRIETNHLRFQHLGLISGEFSDFTFLTELRLNANIDWSSLYISLSTFVR
ncbi:unnamed protein product [Pieris macdunnoughi]|uniref:Uncharacterized protein n=1 Tax=Pieris macdunnoughi TaxID=345717 RepID=A0A821MHY5_9NEOP|nr:unnamed protein product [Pieris macdunnoughi]